MQGPGSAIRIVAKTTERRQLSEHHLLNITSVQHGTGTGENRRELEVRKLTRRSQTGRSGR